MLQTCTSWRYPRVWTSYSTVPSMLSIKLQTVLVTIKQGFPTAFEFHAIIEMTDLASMRHFLGKDSRLNCYIIYRATTIFSSSNKTHLGACLSAKHQNYFLDNYSSSALNPRKRSSYGLHNHLSSVLVILGQGFRWHRGAAEPSCSFVDVLNKPHDSVRWT